MGERAAMNAAVESEGVEFFDDDHSYRLPDGRRVISVTQVLQIAGLVSYAGINPAILDYAAWRGTAVHALTEYLDRGTDIWNQFDINEELVPYLRAYSRFVQEFEWIPDLSEIERPRVVTVRGIEYAMKPDGVGTLRGIPAVLEKKCTAAVHPCWGIQLAGYEAGVKRPERYRNYQRFAVQLKKDGTFKVHQFSDPSDFEMFAHAHSVAAWKLNHKVSQLAA